jgi:D-threo-aldose 1-dehydrogenase
MDHKKLGNTGLALPPIIFGTSALGNLYVALDNDIKLAIVRECFRLVKKPVVFDCAGKYGAGLALEMLGLCLRELRIEPGEVLISNKLGWLRTPLTDFAPTFEKGVWKNLKYDAVQAIGYEEIIECWKQGNELLGGRYTPQLVSVHDPDEYVQKANNEKEKESLFKDIRDAYRALADLKKQGKVKAIGVGAKDWRIIEQLEQHVELDWVMFANSMTLYRHPKELTAFMTYLSGKGITIINSALFNAGFLTGGNYFDYRPIDRDHPENVRLFAWRESFFRLCKEYSVTPSHACIRFGMSHPAVASVALNTSKPEHVKQNVEEVQNNIPPEFYFAMKEAGLIDRDYPFV